MTPEQIATIKAIALIMEKIGSWPVGTMVFAAVAGPWILQFLLQRSQEQKIDQMDRNYEHRFEEVKRMYENNVTLLKTTQELAKNSHELHYYTVEVLTQLKDLISNNLYCPVVRKETKQLEVDR